jgi:hypothetical protein
VTLAEEKALEAAHKQLEKLEREQPSSSSGGQNSGAIQDRVHIESPDGKLLRVMPPKIKTKH